MNSRDDRLTSKNVDEQIEQCLSLPQESLTPTMTSLSRTVQDLQSIYKEDHRLEQAWARINSRVSALNAVRIMRETGELSPALLAQTVPLARRRTKKRFGWLFPLSCFIVGIVILVAAILLIAVFTWPMWAQALRALQAQIPEN